jgi:hypothetical protein
MTADAASAHAGPEIDLPRTVPLPETVFDHAGFDVPGGVNPQSHMHRHIQRLLDQMKKPTGLDTLNILEYEADDEKVGGFNLSAEIVAEMQRALEDVLKAQDDTSYAPWPSKSVCSTPELYG